MNIRVVFWGAIFSGAGATLALIYRSSYLKRRIRRLAGFECDDSLPELNFENNDTLTQAMTARGHVGSTKDIPLLAMEEVTMIKLN
jgi:hypothetical protein